MTHYRTILADPGWQYRNVRTGGSHRSGAAQHYATMSIDDLCALPVDKVADREAAVLFLWTTVPMLHEAFCVLSGWDFEYKTLLVWEKTGRLGMGYWFRVQTELLLVATRGKPKPFRKQFKNIIRAPVGRHSEKPACFRQLIMDCSPGPYLELFARAAEPGWTAVGLDVGTEVRQWLDEASANP